MAKSDMSDPRTPVLAGEDQRALAGAYLDQAADAVVVVDEDGTIRFANRAIEALLGYRPQELAGRPVSDLVPERFVDHERQRRDYGEHPVPRPMGRGLELFVRAADGGEFAVDISLTPIAVGGRRFVVCALRDLRGRSYGGETLRVHSTALRSAASGIVITDRDGRITWVNPAACAITGYASDELVGRHTRILRSGLHGRDFYENLWRTVLSGHAWSGMITNRRKDGSLYHEEQTIAPVLDERGEVTHFIAIKQDVTEKRRLEEALATASAELSARILEVEALTVRLRDQAIRDPLTGLHNRRYLEEALVRDAAHATRTGHPLTLAMLDVDRFKQINDRHGHAIGDLVLLRLADVLRAGVRESDLVCRVGGEEFLVVLPGAPLPAAVRRAEEWRERFAAESVEAPAGSVSSTVSIGVALYRGDSESIGAVLERADRALYAAKAAGRDRVVAEEA
jgi:diguanylate cyclase (GGDEF)-like protein/PAS domain S-box-containing protein